MSESLRSLADFYQAFRDEGYCTDCWVQDGHDEKCPSHTSPKADTSRNREHQSDSEVSVLLPDGLWPE